MIALTLRLRFLLLTLVPSAVIAIVLVGYFTWSAIDALEEELVAKGLASVRHLAPISEFSILSGQQEALYGLTQAAIRESGVRAATIVDTKGKTLAVSGRPSLGADQLRRIPDEARQLAENKYWAAFGAPIWRSYEEADPLFEADPIQRGGQKEMVGGIFFEMDKSELDRKRHDLLMEGALIVLFGLGMLALFAITIADNMARPIMRLVNAVKRISEGNFGTRVSATTSGEIGVLEKGFNDMADHLEGSHQSMVSRIEEATAQLAYQARHDPLTGLFNRREFELRLEKAMAAVEAGSDRCSLLLVSLDRFSQINDACGYLAGDELLRQMALMLQGRLRDEDFLARADGAAFTILLSNSAGNRAHQVAEDICALVGAYRFIWEDEIFPVDVSIGIASIVRDAASATAIMAAADAACREAREKGRNRCSERTTGTRDSRPHGGSWARLIAEGLAEQRLLVEALPLRGLSRDLGATHRVELTARMMIPGQTPVALPALIDAAERYNLAESIDQRLIDTAISALQRARRENRKLCCLLPISRAMLGKRSMLSYIAASLTRHGLDAEGLCFLIPEDLLTHATSQAMNFAQEIQQMRGAVGLDDFGGGLSSFAHLRSLNPAYVKLSPSLTRDSRKSRSSGALLRAIREITAEQNILSIAEGVNTPEMLAEIEKLGIDFAEGKAVGPREPFDVWFEGAVMRSNSV